MLSRLGFLNLALASPALAATGQVAEGAALVAAARRQIGVTATYDHSDRRLSYPGGDVPISTGVCADVVIRATAPQRWRR